MRENGTRVRGANFVARKFNGGFIGSSGSGPDDFEASSASLSRTPSILWPARHKEAFRTPDNNADIEVPLPLVLPKRKLTLVCKCGRREQSILHIPHEVETQDEMVFSCKQCNDPSNRKPRLEGPIAA